MVKPHRKFTTAQPLCLYAKLVFEFFNNDDVDFKHTSLKRVAKELRREHNVSVAQLQDTFIDDPQRGVLLLAIAASSQEQGHKVKEEVLAFLDSNMPARIISEEWQEEELA